MVEVHTCKYGSELVCWQWHILQHKVNTKKNNGYIWDAQGQAFYCCTSVYVFGRNGLKSISSINLHYNSYKIEKMIKFRIIYHIIRIILWTNRRKMKIIPSQLANDPDILGEHTLPSLCTCKVQ